MIPFFLQDTIFGMIKNAVHGMEINQKQQLFQSEQLSFKSNNVGLSCPSHF